MTGKRKRRWVLDRWLDLIEGEPPRVSDVPVLHHYTDAFGVHGIVTSNCLWATAAKCCNVLSEIEYAVSVAMEVIEELWGPKKSLSSWEQLLAEHVRQLLATPLHTFGQPFIVSFCEAGDLLSQWRAYGRKSGFSLAFRPLCRDQKVHLGCKNEFRTWFVRDFYEADKQRARLRGVLEDVV